MSGYQKLKPFIWLTLIALGGAACSPAAHHTGSQHRDIDIVAAPEDSDLDPDVNVFIDPTLAPPDRVKIGDEWIDIMDAEGRAAAELEQSLDENRGIFGSFGNNNDDPVFDGGLIATIAQPTIIADVYFEAEESNVDVDGTMGGEDFVRGEPEAEPEIPAGTHIDAIKICFRTHGAGQMFNPIQTPVTMTFCPSADGAFKTGNERDHCYDYSAINTDRIDDGYFCTWKHVPQRDQPVVYPHHFKYFAIENDVEAPAPSYTNSWLISGIDIQVSRFGEEGFTSIYTAPAFNKLLDANTPVAYGSFRDTGIIANVGVGYQRGAGTNDRLELACAAGPEQAGLAHGSINAIRNHQVPHLRREHNEIIMNLNYLNDRSGREGRFDDLESGHLTTYGAMWFDGDPLQNLVVSERRPNDPYGNPIELERARDVQYKRCRFKLNGGNDTLALRDAGLIIYRPWRPLGERHRSCYLRSDSLEWLTPEPTSRDCRQRGRAGCMSYPPYVHRPHYFDIVGWNAGHCSALKHIHPERAAAPINMLNYFEFAENPTMCVIRHPNAHSDGFWAGGEPNRDDCTRF